MRLDVTPPPTPPPTPKKKHRCRFGYGDVSDQMFSSPNCPHLNPLQSPTVCKYYSVTPCIKVRSHDLRCANTRLVETEVAVPKIHTNTTNNDKRRKRRSQWRHFCLYFSRRNFYVLGFKTPRSTNVRVTVCVFILRKSNVRTCTIIDNRVTNLPG